MATLAPHMPYILLHLLPGNDGERRMLQSLLLSGYDLNATSHLAQQLKYAVQTNALACVQLLSAITGQVVQPGSATTPAAVVPAAAQMASSSQSPAMHISMAEPPRQSQNSAAVLGDAQAAKRSGASLLPASIGADEPIHASQKSIAAAPAQEVPVSMREDMCAAAAPVDLAVQTALVPQQPQEPEDAIPEATSPAAQVSSVTCRICPQQLHFRVCALCSCRVKQRQLVFVTIPLSCHEQGCQGIKTLADTRGEAYELMKVSRFLQKSGFDKLLEQQDQAPAVKDGLAKFDGNMVRYAKDLWQLSLGGKSVVLWMHSSVSMNCLTRWKTHNLMQIYWH